MDNNDLMSTITDIFSNPEAQSKLQGIAGMLNNNNNEKNNSSETDMFGEEMLAYVGRFMQSFNKHDNRIDLLNSIKPYLREARASNIDMAIRIIRLMNIAKDFSLKDVKNVSDI